MWRMRVAAAAAAAAAAAVSFAYLLHRSSHYHWAVESSRITDDPRTAYGCCIGAIHHMLCRLAGELRNVNAASAVCLSG